MISPVFSLRICVQILQLLLTRAREIDASHRRWHIRRVCSCLVSKLYIYIYIYIVFSEYCKSYNIQEETVHKKQTFFIFFHELIIDSVF